MEFITTRYESLTDNYKRLVTLALAIFMTFTVLAFFPLNVLMIYSLSRAYSKNKVNLLLGMKEEALELYEQLKNLRKADSLQSIEKEEDSDEGSTLSEEEVKRVTELTSMTEEDVVGIKKSISQTSISDNAEESKDPVLKKDE